MKIDIQKMKQSGFVIHIEKDYITIEPHSGKDPAPLVELLKSEYGLRPLYAWDVVENMVNYQIVSAMLEE